MTFLKKFRFLNQTHRPLPMYSEFRIHISVQPINNSRFKSIRDTQLLKVWEKSCSWFAQSEREREMGIESSGQWLEKALMELSKKMQTSIELDGEIISGLVSYCEMAPPLDAKEYLDVCKTSLKFLIIVFLNILMCINLWVSLILCADADFSSVLPCFV